MQILGAPYKISPTKHQREKNQTMWEKTRQKVEVGWGPHYQEEKRAQPRLKVSKVTRTRKGKEGKKLERRNAHQGGKSREYDNQVLPPQASCSWGDEEKTKKGHH